MINTKRLDAEQIETANKRFEWLVSFMICSFKFVHQILGIMHKEPTLAIDTIGVNVTEEGKFRLIYNPEFVNSLTDAELTYVFFHEVCHLALHHCTRRPLVHVENKKRMTKEEKKLFRIANVAMDCAVNELVPVNESCQPPRDKDGKLGGVHVAEMKKDPEFEDIEERQTAEWYFDYLMAKAPEEDDGDGGDGDGLGGFDNHDGWAESETADERVIAKVNSIAQNEMWGDVSQAFKEIVMAAQVRKINWRNKIRTFFGNLAWKMKMATRKRPNRKYGYQFPGTKKLYIDRWLVAADTSGSVDEDLLAQWIGVLNQLAEEYPIDFMQFDCDKTEDPHPYDRRKTSLEFKGRGGTDFDPVFEIVEKRKYKGVMILTDGEASAPKKPRIAKVLWVLPGGHTPPVEWGERVSLVKGV